MCISLDSVQSIEAGVAMGFALENTEVRLVTWLWGLEYYVFFKKKQTRKSK